MLKRLASAGSPLLRKLLVRWCVLLSSLAAAAWIYKIYGLMFPFARSPAGMSSSAQYDISKITSLPSRCARTSSHIRYPPICATTIVSPGNTSRTRATAAGCAWTSGTDLISCPL